MLANRKLIAFVATSDRQRAKNFYRDTLGLRLAGDEPFALIFDAGGTMLRITPVERVVVAPYTILGWHVDDVAAVARALRQSGVEAQRYPGLEQDADGVWTSPGGARVLWFKDPDGNTLSVTQS
jgi:catechol 2,3-dioxygenase-like lactoylglutathione lyase family enzyme